MLFQITKSPSQDTRDLKRVEATTLSGIGLKELDLQELLFKNVNLVIRSTELLPIAQSRRWQEEPDILALDQKGTLYIFELKAWESRKENLLQVMRYAQKFSMYDYERLNSLWHKFEQGDLLDAHTNHFDLENPIDRDKINAKHVLIVMTNGLDIDTRQAIKYWKSKGVKIQPWVYRVYSIDGKEYISFEAFGTADDPYDDLISSYHLVNTCRRWGEHPHDNMIKNERAAIYGKPKILMKNIKKGDTVFLYQTESVGIVAYGVAKGNYREADWNDKKGDQYYVDLDRFKILDLPLPPGELRDIAGYKVPLIGSYTSIRKEAGEALIAALKER